VRVINLDAGDHVIDITRVVQNEDPNDDDKEAGSNGQEEVEQPPG